MEARLHRPVLLEETLDGLAVRAGGTYADLTFGEGGHTEAMLDRGAASVLALDRDPRALARYRESGRLRDDPRLTLVHRRFSGFAGVAGATRFDGILADLGVSTRQLLEAERGFSFAAAGPLDMRMDPDAGEPLAEILDGISVDELAERFRADADLEKARGTARRVLDAFHAGRLGTTADLASLFPPPPGHKGSHPATPVFLALRMLVNDETGEVARGLPPLVDRLRPGGRLAVITFHSTEDRAVKRLFNELAGRCVCERSPCLCPRREVVRLVTRKPVVPGDEELARNPRARSAKLRCVEKTGSEP